MGFSSGTLANISLFSQAAGGVASAFGAASQASIQKGNLGAQAAIAEANARIAELGAQAELRDGHQRIAQATAQYGQLKSRQRAAMAANGIALDEGSAADVEASTDAMGEWLVPLLLVAVVALCGYIVWQRCKQRAQGWS